MKRIILVLTAALILAAMIVAVAPAMAQEKTEEKKTEEKQDGSKDKDKYKEKKDDKDLPKSGGLPVNASLLGLGGSVLLVGGGLVALSVTRRH